MMKNYYDLEEISFYLTVMHRGGKFPCVFFQMKAKIE